MISVTISAPLTSLPHHLKVQNSENLSIYEDNSRKMRTFSLSLKVNAVGAMLSDYHLTDMKTLIISFI